MKRCELILLTMLFVLSLPLAAQERASATDYLFRFVPGNDMFYVPWGGNGTELSRLYALVDEYRAEITSGKIPVYVDGYCSSPKSRKENLRMAAVRSNRVKSELITNKGLIEDNFITKNHAAAYDGHRNMVVVRLRIPAKVEPDNVLPEQECREREAAEQARREQAEFERIERERAQAGHAAREQTERDALLSQSQPAAPSKPYCFALRTNLLYDAFLTPTLGVEWRPNRNIGIKVDGSRAHWGDEKGKVQRLWLVSPEVRWYLGRARRLYVGASSNVGEYNIYKGVIGGILSGDTGYQGKLWGAGLTVGYQLMLSRTFSLDFNLGLGYTRFEYDRFTVSNEVRVFKEKDKTKNFWGPTQAGVTFVWQLGK